MALLRLRVEGVRCLSHAELELDPERNVIAGPNGAGKTSLLESIHLLARGRSFRTRQTRRLVQKGQEGFAVFGEVGAGGAQRERVGVAFGRDGLAVQINGQPAQGMAELAETLVVHVVDPSAHGLVEGGPTARRRFLDGAVFHVEHGYLKSWRHYRRVLGQRNAALKAAVGAGELDAWSRQLVEAGAVIDRARRAHIEALARILAPMAERLLGVELSLDYRTGWRQGLTLDEALEQGASRDREAGFTQAGPHRADLAIRMDGHRVEEHASRGQQKLVAAGLVVAEAACLQNSGVGNGVLLVDDPAAELDAAALARLVAEIDALPVQRIFTAIDPAAVSRSHGALFHVEQGKVQPVL